MDSALIVSSTNKGVALFSELLNAASLCCPSESASMDSGKIIALPTCGEARRLLLEREFDLVIVNAPLRDETGESLSRYIASRGISQVILVVKSECYDAVSSVCAADGVLVIAKPVNKAIFWSAINLARAAGATLKRMRDENSKLKQSIEDIRIVDRAKFILISYLSMSEREAHRYIEKQAMDMRLSKRAVAEGILKTYEY